MAVESGRVTATREARMSVRLRGGEVVECLVDTGFTGALMLPRKTVRKLGVSIIGREVFEMVGRRFLTASITLTEVNWLGQWRTVRVVVSEESDSLIGTEMLDRTRIVIDYVNDTVSVTS